MTKPDEAKRDVVLLGPPTADGEGVHVLRARDEVVEAGELRALREGAPITGEVVTLRPREDAPRICDVTESFVPPRPAAAKAEPLPTGPKAKALPATRKGPAQVATDAYREGWDDIFGPRPSRPSSLN